MPVKVDTTDFLSCRNRKTACVIKAHCSPLRPRSVICRNSSHLAAGENFNPGPKILLRKYKEGVDFPNN